MSNAQDTRYERIPLERGNPAAGFTHATVTTDPAQIAGQDRFYYKPGAGPVRVTEEVGVESAYDPVAATQAVIDGRLRFSRDTINVRIPHDPQDPTAGHSVGSIPVSQLAHAARLDGVLVATDEENAAAAHAIDVSRQQAQSRFRERGGHVQLPSEARAGISAEQGFERAGGGSLGGEGTPLISDTERAVMGNVVAPAVGAVTGVTRVATAGLSDVALRAGLGQEGAEALRVLSGEEQAPAASGIGQTAQTLATMGGEAAGYALPGAAGAALDLSRAGGAALRGGIENASARALGATVPRAVGALAETGARGAMLGGEMGAQQAVSEQALSEHPELDGQSFIAHVGRGALVGAIAEPLLALGARGLHAVGEAVGATARRASVQALVPNLGVSREAQRVAQSIGRQEGRAVALGDVSELAAEMHRLQIARPTALGTRRAAAAVREAAGAGIEREIAVPSNVASAALHEIRGQERAYNESMALARRDLAQARERYATEAEGLRRVHEERATARATTNRVSAEDANARFDDLQDELAGVARQRWEQQRINVGIGEERQLPEHYRARPGEFLRENEIRRLEDARFAVEDAERRMADTTASAPPLPSEDAIQAAIARLGQRGPQFDPRTLSLAMEGPQAVREIIASGDALLGELSVRNSPGFGTARNGVRNYLEELSESLQSDPSLANIHRQRASLDRLIEEKGGYRQDAPEHSVGVWLMRLRPSFDTAFENAGARVAARTGDANWSRIFNGYQRNYQVSSLIERAAEHISSSGMARSTLLGGAIGTGLGFAVGGPTGAALGLGLGIGQAARRQAGRGMEYLGSRMGGWMARSGMLGDAAAEATLARRTALRDFVNGTGRVVQAGRVPYSVETYDRIRERLSAYTADRDAWRRGVAEALTNIGRNDPALAGAMAGALGRGMDYLASLAPSSSLAGRGATPSRAHRAQLLAAAETVESPTVVIDRLRDGTLTPDHVTALRNVYPDYYDALRADLQEAAAKATVPPTAAQRRMTRILLGEPERPALTPSALRIVQSRFAAPGTPQVGQSQNSDLPSRSATMEQQMGATR